MENYKGMYIKITQFSDIRELVQKAQNVKGDVTIKRGKYVVDAKSLMGVMSLDVSAGVTVEYPIAATDFEIFIIQFHNDN